MKLKKDKIVSFLLFLIGIFCQINQLMSKKMLIAYLFVCIILFCLVINAKKTKLGIGFYWYFGFLLLNIFSLAYTVNYINPDYVYLRIIIYTLLLLMTVPFYESKDNINKLFIGCLIGGLIGITFVLFNQYSLIGIRRLGSGIYGSYAEFGSACSTTIVSFLYLRKTILKNRIVKVLLFAYILSALLLSGARKALLIFILVLLLTQIFDKRKMLSKKVLILTVTSVAALSIIYASINNEYLYKFIGHRIETGINSVIGEEKADASLEERNYAKNIAKNLFIQKPIKGWGIHGFAYKYYVMGGKLVFSHDGFLEILSCYGIIGFLIYYWVFIYIIINRKKVLRDELGIFMFSYIITILLMEFYAISFYNAYFILLVGICANTINKRRKSNEEISKENCMSIAG